MFSFIVFLFISFSMLLWDMGMGYGSIFLFALAAAPVKRAEAINRDRWRQGVATEVATEEAGASAGEEGEKRR